AGARADGDGDLYRGRPVGRARRARRLAAVEPGALRRRRDEREAPGMTQTDTVASLPCREHRRPLLCPLPLREMAAPSFSKGGWVRGSLRKRVLRKKPPHPFECGEAPSCPLPQGERAQQRALRLRQFRS